MDRNVLLIVAAGKSSRFGGFPKAFCKIGDITNAENTIKQASKLYEKVYIGVNQNTYARVCGNINNCEMFKITTGQGDAHSILKCLTYIRNKEPDLKKITVCWGDAVFIDGKPFEQLLEGATATKVAVACATDDTPYAWFETDDNCGIIKSHFALREGRVERGVHDQSLFLFDFEFAIQYLNEYRKLLGIPSENDERNADQNEMKLLYSFEFLYQSDYEPAKCVEITGGKVFSFNTADELEMIKRKFVAKG